MSYSAPARTGWGHAHSIDTLSSSWIGSWVQWNTSITFGTANLGVYVPLRVPRRVVVVKMWIGTNTTGTGNVDLGLYDMSGVAVISATGAAKAASSTELVFDVTDTVVGPGTYYIAASCDSGTDTFWGYQLAAPLAAVFGVRTETSAYPLPATATMDLNQAAVSVPLVGLLVEGTVA